MRLAFRHCNSLKSRQKLDHNRITRTRLPVKCRSSSGSTSSGSTSSSSQQQGPDKRILLEQLTQAIATEDYASAAALKQQIKELDLLNPLYGLTLALEQAVEEERYEDAARLRDQIKDFEELSKPQVPQLCGISTSSNTLTKGIRVQVQSHYVPAHSRPELGQFFFTYTVTISNEGQDVIMLKSRHWVITDGTGKVDHVRGPGVVGKQPILEPGSSFEYQSACPLFTTVGSMEGEYIMVVLDQQGDWAEELQVKIGKFALKQPGGSEE